MLAVCTTRVALKEDCQRGNVDVDDSACGRRMPCIPHAPISCAYQSWS